jgi:hypothetical protein
MHFPERYILNTQKLVVYPYRKLVRAVSNSPPSNRPFHHSFRIDRPPYRRLNTYAFDPSLSIELENAALNCATTRVPWEPDLKPGPVGEYLEVVDYDPASRCIYEPVDLNDPFLLAQDGLAPSEGNPQFHQQMAYAVTMTTIKNFERSLGRLALWRPFLLPDSSPEKRHDVYVPRLRIYPHALREANAFYSPQKRALLLGYFPAPTDDVRFHLPGGIVFCCLSHDVVAHETTHALLDGMHRRFIEPSNVDVLAFHEAFADICALFQHFSMTEVLQQQIAKTRGDLSTENLLGQLAQEFGNATGFHGALRDALGKVKEETGRWEATKPDPQQLASVTEPHARGSLLVAALFLTFVSIYKARSADLLRIATSGTGVLPEGALHPDLVKRLAAEAAKAAEHVLDMCIRALDYCPPVDLTFGEYLRALITADYDLVPDDDLNYRVAIIEAFRQYGIYPPNVRSLSVDSLRWQGPIDQDFAPLVLPTLRGLRSLANRQQYATEREWVYDEQHWACLGVWKVFMQAIDDHATNDILGGMGMDATRLGANDRPIFEVHSARPARRTGPDGQRVNEVVIEVTQRRPAYFDSRVQTQVEKGLIPAPPPDFWFRGGSTLVVDLESGELRYSIAKDIRNERRLAAERAYRGETGGSPQRAMYFGGLQKASSEPFALLHRRAGQAG